MPELPGGKVMGDGQKELVPSLLQHLPSHFPDKESQWNCLDTKDSVRRTVLETDLSLQFQTNLIELMQYSLILKFNSIHLHTPFTLW